MSRSPLRRPLGAVAALAALLGVVAAPATAGDLPEVEVPPGPTVEDSDVTATAPPPQDQSSDRDWTEVGAESLRQDAREMAAGVGPQERARVVSVLEVGGRPEVEVEPVRGLQQAAAAIEAAQADPRTVAVELDSPVQMLEVPEWDDQFRYLQWALDTLRAEEAAGHAGDISRAVVAVIDTGVDGNHPDLGGAVRRGTDFVSGGNGWADGNGHGTHVAGIVAARADNGIGVAGYAQNTRILPVRVLGDDGSGSASAVTEGIFYATDQGAPVLNLSLGGASYSSTMATAVEYAQEKGALVVAAAGNDKQNGNPVTYPAAYPGVLGVGATDQNDKIAPFSNTGSYVDISAPGVKIASTYVYEDQYGQMQYEYVYSSGTSMAAPYVAAAAAQLEGVNPALSAMQIADLLTSHSVDLGISGRDDVYGAGRLDAFASLQATPAAERLSGDNRYTTAAAVSRDYAKGVNVAYVANGTKFPGAMTAAAPAGRDESPLLLVKPDLVPPATAQELNRLRPSKIVVVGGPESVHPETARELEQYATSGSVTRLYGDNRYTTAADVSGTYPKGVDVAYVANGTQFPGAMTAAAPAGRDQAPLLLVKPDLVPPATAEELERLQPRRIVLVGGPESVDEETEAALTQYATSGKVTRLFGDNRYTTAANVAQDYPAGTKVVYVVNGTKFPGAMTAAAPAGRDGAPLLLVKPNALVPATVDELVRLAPERIVIVGGPESVSTTVRGKLAQYLP